MTMRRTILVINLAAGVILATCNQKPEQSEARVDLFASVKCKLRQNRDDTPC